MEWEEEWEDRYNDEWRFAGRTWSWLPISTKIHISKISSPVVPPKQREVSWSGIVQRIVPEVGGGGAAGGEGKKGTDGLEVADDRLAMNSREEGTDGKGNGNGRVNAHSSELGDHHKYRANPKRAIENLRKIR